MNTALANVTTSLYLNATVLEVQDVTREIFDYIPNYEFAIKEGGDIVGCIFIENNAYNSHSVVEIIEHRPTTYERNPVVLSSS